METDKCEENPVYAIRIILIVIGLIMIEIYYATPGIMLYKFYKQQLPEKLLPTIQILTNFLNTINWIISGTKDVIDIQKIICNSIGATIGGVLVFFLWMIYSKNKKNEHLIYLFMIFNIFFQIFYALFRFIKNREVNQYLSGAFNILMYSTPLIHTYYAYKNKNRDIIPIINVTFGAIASFAWTIYGIIGVVKCNKDYESMISNSISFVILIINIIMYFRIEKPKNRISTTEPLYNRD